MNLFFVEWKNFVRFRFLRSDSLAFHDLACHVSELIATSRCMIAYGGANSCKLCEITLADCIHNLFINSVLNLLPAEISIASFNVDLKISICSKVEASGRYRSWNLNLSFRKWFYSICYFILAWETARKLVEDVRRHFDNKWLAFSHGRGQCNFNLQIRVARVVNNCGCSI